MRLLELTPEETVFLTSPPAASGCVQARLTRRLAAVLTARLHLQVQTLEQAADAPGAAPEAPGWRVDAALATLWLTRRLGGQRLMGETPFVPPSLVQALDAALAECWLDTAADAAPPAAMAWQVTTASTQATLAVALPHHPIEMTRWAREVIRHA